MRLNTTVGDAVLMLKLKSFLCLALLGTVFGDSFAFAQVRATPNPTQVSVRDDAAVERRIGDLLSRMTLAEKLGQLQQLDGEANGKYRPEHPDMIRKGLLGSTLNVRGAKQVNELQRIAMNESRMKIPMLFAFDVIHGYRTIFPVPLGETASWDAQAAEESARIAAREASATGVRWTFAPMVDVARDARWGRIVEGAGEDPYLSSIMARARVLGFQGTDYSQPDRVVACAKHWVAYGAAEGGRDYNTTDMSEHALREIYFPPFKAALDAGVGTFMSAFNDLNGVPTSANRFTLTDVLRGEWKFDGVVVSDYESVKEVINHGFAADGADAARLALNAGVDMEMVSRLYNQHAAQLMKENKLTQSTIDEAVRRVLRIKLRLGLFENPYVDEAREAREILNAEHRAAARRIAARSMVLLKNENNLLPASKTVNSIAVVGALADDPKAPLGSWTGDGRAEDTVTLLEGIKAKVSASTKVTFAKGVSINVRGASGNYDDAPVNESNAGGTNVAQATAASAARSASAPVSATAFDEAVSAARASDLTIIAVGETAEMSGEAASRTTLDLPGRQLELVQAIHATGKPYVVVLMNGRPLAINWMAENSSAILETWFAGTEAGNAIADVLFGDVNPSGKLPVTFPRAAGQSPMYYNHKATGRPPTTGKYTSKYLDVPVTPLYPFGHGLSYTKFALSNLRLSRTRIKPDGRVNVILDVANTGTRAGDEIVQLYIRDLVGSLTRPVRELKAFERITLQPGEKRQVSFTLTPAELGFINRQNRFVVEPGAFKIFAGTSSVGGLEIDLTVE
ncbi:MAG: beta-glucosidase BglX [Pyrinomonadaceae bacterium MAG19_C2-C3]|nr:beta-glucosidase BglX [Pyrinomonadaceae bacterium MAG19_C2-C3]